MFHRFPQTLQVKIYVSALVWCPKVDDHDDYYVLIFHILNKNDDDDFLKYDVALLTFAIKVHDLDLIDDIYNRCLNLFKQDYENNKSFFKYF